MGNPDFGCVVSLPDTTYITPRPLILAPFISFPIRALMCPLGPHRVSLPLPLSTPWVGPKMMPQRLMQLKKKIKSIISSLSTGNVTQNAKDGCDIQHMGKIQT